MYSYLDNNATTQPLPEVVAAVNDALLRGWGNPSSVHRAGMEARRLVELARESVAQLVGASDREIVFTSGGTEGAGLAIAGTLAMMPERRVIVTMRTEHSAVREACEVFAKRSLAEVIWLECDSAGNADVAALDHILEKRAAEIALVSVMWANNETGAVQPVAEIGARCRARGVRFHTDATQWVGRMTCDLRSMHVDLASFAAHKFHGPKGVGALWIRSGVRVAPQAIGGPQERERRGGTENVPGIAGMGAAAEAARVWLAGDGRVQGAALRDRFERAVIAAIPDAVVNAGGAPRLWNTSNIGFPGLEAEAILLLLSERGVSASAGAACSSGSLDPSPVLLAMGVPPRVAHGSVRFSLSRLTTEAEVLEAERIVPECIERLRRSA
ncbi:MAG: aminotransferase class V-fold PLP-dependent enzyme [Planctomycetota bacterium]|nr:MAG: aminotransferase class V-fold PLP-dependent enzyme [Planctomycetota bacterium]